MIESLSTSLKRWLPAMALLLPLGCSDGPSESTSDAIDDEVQTSTLAPATESAPDIELLEGDKLSLLDGLQYDAQLIDSIPAVVARVVLADSGLQVAYTRLGQELAAEPRYIESQWLAMQDCTAQTSSAPLVVVVDDSVDPLSAEDDVVFDLRGVPVASASLTDAPVIQIGFDDFAGADKPRGAYLRTIMARYLWLRAGLPERDFPYTCL